MKCLQYILLSLTVVTCSSPYKLNAQTLSFETQVNTVAPASIIISIIPSPLESNIVAIDPINAVAIQNGNVNLLANIDGQNKLVRNSRKSIKIRITNLSKSNLDDLVSQMKGAKIIFDSDLKITLENNSILEYSIDQVADASKGNLLFDDDQRAAYIEASGGAYAFMKNRFELGYVPKEQSNNVTNDFTLDFAYRKSYSFINGNKAYFTTEGLVSTNATDSLNFIKIYPLSFKLTDTDRLAETVIEVGLEGDQKFNYWRASANLEHRLIFKNLINLSDGENRLRLKPVVSIGLKLYSEQGNIRPEALSSNENSGQIYANLYYVIPVFESFTIIANVNGFYDVNESVNPEEEFQFNYQLSMGYELKGKGFQTLVTYRSGKTDVNYQDDSLLSLGILAQLSK